MRRIVIRTPLGEMIAAGEGESLLRLDFAGSRFAPRFTGEERSLPVLEETRRWVELYFSGAVPDFTPALEPAGSAFQRAVWALLREIPYGGSATYGELARRLSREADCAASPRAVGQAVGRNPVSLIVPCHRVLGAGGALTGYAAGIETKKALLRLERIPFKE